MKLTRALLVAALLLAAFNCPAETLKLSRRPTGTGWLEREPSGQLILHLAGSWYDMGRQQGELMKDEVGMTVRALGGMADGAVLGLSARQFEPLGFLFLYSPSAPFIPPLINQEMRGLADAAGIPYWRLQTLHSLIMVSSCSGTAVFGKASRDGELYQTRSLDYGLDMVDPRTGTPLQDISLVTVYRPADGIGFVTFGWPGFLGSIGGMNAAGVCISEMTNSSRFEQTAALPMIFRVKQTLARAHNLEEAARFMTRRPIDGGYNFLIGDGNARRALALETNALTYYLGGWDGPAESAQYQYERTAHKYEPLEGVLIRTNHPLSPKIVRNFIDQMEGQSRASGPRYTDLRARAQAGYGKWDLESLFLAQREHYQKLCDGADNGRCQATIYQAAYAPKSGDFMIGFARGRLQGENRYAVSAYNQPYGRYNLFKLLEEQPGE